MRSRDTVKAHVFLIGMMGAGKTYWGRKLATSSGISFLDLDALIVSEEKRSVNDIFENEGENYFRQIESRTLKNLLNKERFILATGGGTPCFFDNMDWMNSNGLTVWIDEPVDVLMKRLKHDRDRPVLRNCTPSDSRSYIESLLKERTEYYKRAHVHLRPPAITLDAFVKILSDE